MIAEYERKIILKRNKAKPFPNNANTINQAIKVNFASDVNEAFALKVFVSKVVMKVLPLTKSTEW